MSSPKSRGPLIGGLVLIAMAIGLAFCGVSSRARALSVVTNETREMAVPTVAVVKPTAGAPQEELVLPGTMQPFSDAPIYARTSGYVRRRPSRQPGPTSSASTRCMRSGRSMRRSTVW